MGGEPGFKVRFCGRISQSAVVEVVSRKENKLTLPALIQPTPRIRRRLPHLLGHRLITLAGLLQQHIALPRLWHRDTMPITKRLKLAIRPGIQDPVLHVDPRMLGLILRLIPRVSDAGDEGIPGVFCRSLGLDTLLLQVAEQVLGTPGLVGLDGVGAPLLLNERLEVLAVGWGGAGDSVVGEPALQLRLVPLVVCYVMSVCMY